MNNKFVLLSNNKFWIFSIILTLLFVLPVTIFGIKDQEAYQLHFFSLGFHLNNIDNFFVDYVDFYGPGTYLSTLEEDKLSISNLFFFNTQLYFFIKYFFYIFVQIFFLKKIFDLFKINNKIFILYSIFSLSNFNYIYSDDWHTIFSYSIIFPILYYLISFFKFKKSEDFFLLIFFSSYQLANGHFGNISIHYVFFFIFVFLQRNLFFFKKKYFYIGLTIFLLISFNKLYNLTFQYLEFPKNLPPVTQPGHSILDVILAQFNVIFNFNNMNRSAFFGIISYLALFYSFQIFLKKESKKIFYINIFFIILFVLTFLPILEKFFFISAGWQSRDITNIISIILVGLMFKELNNSKLKYYTHLITIIFIIIVFFKNNLNYIDWNKFNFIAKKIEDTTLIKSLENISKQINHKNISKVYLSPEVDSMIRKNFSRYGVYAVTDLTKYKLYPLNGWFKYSSKDNIWPSKSQMHGFISSDYKTFNNEIFLNFFLVDKIIYFKDEEDKITIEHEIIDEINLNHLGRTIIIAKRSLLGLKFFKDKKIQCKENYINCILNENYFENNKNLKFNRLGLNKIEIINKNNNKINFIFPYTDPDNWKIYENEKLLKNSKSNKIFELKILNLNSNSKYRFEYLNNVNFYSNLISVTGQLLLFLFVIFLKLVNNRKSRANYET